MRGREVVQFEIFVKGRRDGVNRCGDFLQQGIGLHGREKMTVQSSVDVIEVRQQLTEPIEQRPGVQQCAERVRHRQTARHQAQTIFHARGLNQPRERARGPHALLHVLKQILLQTRLRQLLRYGPSCQSRFRALVEGLRGTDTCQQGV